MGDNMRFKKRQLLLTGCIGVFAMWAMVSAIERHQVKIGIQFMAIILFAFFMGRIV